MGSVGNNQLKTPQNGPVKKWRRLECPSSTDAIPSGAFQTPTAMPASDPLIYRRRECPSSMEVTPSEGLQTQPATPSSDPSRRKRQESPLSTQGTPFGELQTPLAASVSTNNLQKSAGTNPLQMPSNLKRQECPSSTQVRPTQGFQTPPVPCYVPGSPQNPVNISEGEGDTKPIINPLSRLKAFQFSNKKRAISQNSSEECSNIVRRMKKLLVSELLSPDNINMDINTMIEHANGTFTTSDFLNDDDVAFYNHIRSYIYWFYEWSIADGLKHGLMKEFTDFHQKLQVQHEKAEEDVEITKSNLSDEKKKGALMREKIKCLEQELVQSEARVLMLSVEKERREQVLQGVKVELKAAVTKTKKGMEMVEKIDDRRKAAVNGISEIKMLLKPYSM